MPDRSAPKTIAFFFTVGGVTGTTLGTGYVPADTAATLAQRLVDAINGTFVGICAAPTATAGQFRFPKSLSPINGFTLSVSTGAGTTGTITMTGDIGAGNEGVWAVDASQVFAAESRLHGLSGGSCGTVAGSSRP